MADNGGAPRTPRATKSQIATVRKTAEKASEELDREQEESVRGLAEALGEIGEGEAFAHIDARVAFLERQVERLLQRREEADRGIQAEFAVMRARIEDALQAVGATAEEQRDLGMALERRINARVADSENEMSDVLDGLRKGLITKVDEATAKFEKTEARLRGETKALEGSVEERVMNISDSVAEALSEVEAASDAMTDRVEQMLTASKSALDERMVELATSVDSSLASAREQLSQTLDHGLEDVERRVSELAEALEGSTAATDSKVSELTSSIDRRTDEAKKLVAAMVVEAESKVEALAQRVGDLSTTLPSELEQQLEAKGQSIIEELEQSSVSNRGEIEGRLSELRAEVRIENQRIREQLQEKLAASAEALQALAKETKSKLQASETNAASAAARLEAMIAQATKEIAAGEGEWSEVASGVNDEISQLKIRVEELVGRVASSEARRATERGSSQVALESLSARLEVIDKRVREAVEEVSAKNTSKVEALTSQVERLNSAQVDADEQGGAVEYLTRRVGEIAEKVDEALTKVNTLGRYVTKKTGIIDIKETAEPTPAVIPSEILERLNSIEKSLAEVASPAAPPELMARLERIEKSLAQLRPPVTEPGSPDIVARMDALERTISTLSATISSRQAQIAARIEEIEDARPATNILPQKKKTRW